MDKTIKYPKIVQGGMGVYISGWILARTVAMLSQLGTVSGTALEWVMARTLQRGDPGGHYRRALATFPFPHISQKVIDEYFVGGGIPDGKLFKPVGAISTHPSDLLISLIICANYANVWLAKEGHENLVSINYLEKIAIPHIYAITGAMLAGIDFITMGAGIALQIPEVIDDIANGRPTSYRIPVIGTNITSFTLEFNPEKFFGGKLPLMKKPGFIPIISSNLLANIFVKKLPEGSVYGFVIEEPTAGGHNAPPRKGSEYGEKDKVDYLKIAELGLPFWIGGAKATPELLAWAISVGAEGVQVGSIFALCEQSGMDQKLRTRCRELGFAGELEIETNFRISPTGFPFKTASLDETISNPEVFNGRSRICNVGQLASLYEKPDGSIGYRCAADALQLYAVKGGSTDDTISRGCVCNGLLATCGLNNLHEPALVTLGDYYGFLKHLIKTPNDSYTAEDAIKYLLGHLK